MPYDFSQPFQMHLYKRSTSSALLRGLLILWFVIEEDIVPEEEPAIPWPPTLTSIMPSSPPLTVAAAPAAGVVLVWFAFVPAPVAAVATPVPMRSE